MNKGGMNNTSDAIKILRRLTFGLLKFRLHANFFNSAFYVFLVEQSFAREENGAAAAAA